MDPRSSNQKRLDPLPENLDEELGAEIHHNITPEVVTPKGSHYFIRKSGHEAQCTHCDWGFALDPGDKIVDGHLFDKAGKLVI